MNSGSGNAAEKTWANIRARAACLGLEVHRSDERDGPARVFTVEGGTIRTHADLGALGCFPDGLNGTGLASRDDAASVDRDSCTPGRFAVLQERAARAGYLLRHSASGYVLSRGNHSRHSNDLSAIVALITQHGGAHQ